MERVCFLFNRVYVQDVYVRYTNQRMRGMRRSKLFLAGLRRILSFQYRKTPETTGCINILTWERVS